MALRPEAARLTEAHRVAQSRLSAAVSLFVLNAWRAIVRMDDIDSTSRLWLEIVLPRILAGRRRSADLAAAYANQFRAAEIEAELVAMFDAIKEANEEQIRTSMTVTGPVALKQRIKTANRLPAQRRHAELDKAFTNSGVGAAGAAIKHVGEGARDTLDEVPRRDPQAIGWLRVTKADPCYFCAALASRGPRYRDDSFDDSDPRFFGPGEHKVHDHCGCGLEPVYHRDAPWPGRGKEFEELWKSSTRNAGDKMNAFRRAYEGRGN